MAKYRVEGPEGAFEIEGPGNASDDDIRAAVRDHLRAAGKSYADAPNRINRPEDRTSAARARQYFTEQPTGRNGVAGTSEPSLAPSLPALGLQGATFGLSDEIMGAGGALYDAVAAPFDSGIDFNPAASYRAARDLERDRVAATRKAYPWASTLMELGGGLLTGGTAAQGLLQGAGVSARPGIAGALQTAAQGAKAGVVPGAVSGFGYGEGADNSVAGAGLGAALGGAVGAALPIAFNAVAKPVTTALNYLRPQNGVGRSMVGQAMRDDAITPTMAAQRILAAHQRGVPLALADLGENLRGLAGGVSRKPGPSRRLVRGMLTERQAEQGERVRGALARDLGPVANVDAVSEQIMQRANTAANPLYDTARQAPVISTPEMEAVLATPAGRQALAQAHTIARNERRDPQALGFVLDADGNVSLNPTLNIADDGSIVQEPARQRGYTLDTIDLVKRGLDAVLEPNRNPVTRRLDLSGNPLAQSQNTVRQQLLREADRLNPDYAAARAAFAEPARERDALLQGEKMVTASAEEVERATAGLTPTQRAQYALGYRSKLAEDLERRVTGGDKVNALIGTPRKQRALGQLFGDEPGMTQFGDTLGDEALANETYRAVMTGSPTANRLADDAASSDEALLEDLGGKALKGAANGGFAGFGAEIFNGLRDVSKFGAGATGKRAREDAAALLTEVDPVLFSESLRAGLRQQAVGRAQQRAVRRRVRNAGMFGARLGGGVSAYGLRPAGD